MCPASAMSKWESCCAACVSTWPRESLVHMSHSGGGMQAAAGRCVQSFQPARSKATNVMLLLGIRLLWTRFLACAAVQRTMLRCCLPYMCAIQPFTPPIFCVPCIILPTSPLQLHQGIGGQGHGSRAAGPGPLLLPSQGQVQRQQGRQHDHPGEAPHPFIACCCASCWSCCRELSY